MLIAAGHCGVLSPPPPPQVVEDSGDRMNFLVAGKWKFVFLLRGPVYLVMAAQTRESAWQLKEQLASACCPPCTSASAVRGQSGMRRQRRRVNAGGGD